MPQTYIRARPTTGSGRSAMRSTSARFARPRRAARRSCRMRTLPGIAPSSSPAMAANSSATPVGRVPDTPRKLICTGTSFCRMKISRKISTMRGRGWPRPTAHRTASACSGLARVAPASGSAGRLGVGTVGLSPGSPGARHRHQRRVGGRVGGRVGRPDAAVAGRPADRGAWPGSGPRSSEQPRSTCVPDGPGDPDRAHPSARKYSARPAAPPTAPRRWCRDRCPTFSRRRSAAPAPAPRAARSGR